MSGTMFGQQQDPAERERAVVAQLKRAGVATSRLVPHGFGAQLPLDCNRSLYDLWWRVYNRTASDALAGADAPAAAALRAR